MWSPGNSSRPWHFRGQNRVDAARLSPGKVDAIKNDAAQTIKDQELPLKVSISAVLNF